MPHKYKLLVSDIDGTLADGSGVISAADKKALVELHRAGIKVSLCTAGPRRMPGRSSKNAGGWFSRIF